MVMNFVNNPQIPTAYTSFVLGATIALFFAFFINIFSKISAHAVGMGGMLGMVVITMLLFSYDTFTVPILFGQTLQLNMMTVFLVMIILCGLVGTARLILQAHDPRDVYGGFLVGFTAQFIALRFLF
jgi:drug/metabolite transporter (DMT)-like permease